MRNSCSRFGFQSPISSRRTLIRHYPCEPLLRGMKIEGTGLARGRFAGVKSKSGSRENREPLCTSEMQTVYWVGRVICVKPTVLIDRSRGERGGSHCGPWVKF